MNAQELDLDSAVTAGKTLNLGSGDVPTARMAVAKPAQLPPLAQAFLDNLLRMKLLTASLAGQFLQANAPNLPELKNASLVGEALIRSGLLTQYQLDRLYSGTTHGLVLGSYRVLARLGSGGMGTVFLGEHMMMRRRVAIKVLPVDDDCPSSHLDRFYAEMRVLAQLQHPNIVMAFDSGRVPAQSGFPQLLYLVMELIDGCNMEQHVRLHGPVAIAQACNWIRQAASGLQEAHNRELIHRDVKPSNLLLTKNEQVKLVDFGLVRQFSLGLTDPRSTIGTLAYMPPEQSTDPTSVGSQADIYSLGGTLFWLLTGQPPYPPATSLIKAMQQIRDESPRRLRTLQPDAPPALEAILLRMLDRDPMRRPPMALSVMKLLEPFVAS
jgi:serine/threonine protein kinase